MGTPTPDDTPVIGKMSFSEVIAKLREMDNEEAAADLEAAQNNFYSRGGTLGTSSIPDESTEWQKFWNKPWTSTDYEIGYLPRTETDEELRTIQHAGTAKPNIYLQNAHIKISLGHFRVVAYPGWGTHHILLEFSVQNQVQDSMEALHFNAFCNARQGAHANIYSYPIFVGLAVGKEGINFEVSTVEVQNLEDKKFLSFLESDVFKSGLQLLSSVQPVVALFSNMAYNLTLYIAKHRKNAKVQNFKFGLDFDAHSGKYPLSEGLYIIVQVPGKDRSAWNWEQWGYQPTRGLVVNKKNPNRLIPYNYMTFIISKMEDK